MPTSISNFRAIVAVAALCGAAGGAHAASPTPKTVCTITVNSPDEKETFRRHLPPGNVAGRDEVVLACARGGEANKEPALQPLLGGALARAKVTNAAVLACLGNQEARARVVRAVTSEDAGDMAIARAYLRHQPLADAAEVRAVSTAIARMSASDAQVRALDTLAQQRVSDGPSLRRSSPAR